MIRVTVDLITHDTGSAGKRLYTVDIVNDGTGTILEGNYNVHLYDHLGIGGKPIHLRNHLRLDENALALARRALNALQVTP